VSKEILSTDVVVIGAGPVGLFTVFQCGMLKINCHVIDTLDMVGGQCAALYPEKPIYDIPGHPVITGQALIDQLEKQAAPFDTVYHLSQQVTAVCRVGERWRVTTSKGRVLEAKAVVLAAGVGAFGPNRPPLEGLEAYEGRSVFYMVAKPEAFRGKKVVIAGGGDTALDWSLILADVAEKVYVIHRRPKFRGAPESVARLHYLAESGRIELVVPYQLHGLEGDQDQLTGVVVRDLDGNTRTLEADRLLPFFGLSMNLGPIADWGLNLDQHLVAVDPLTQQTNLPGFYAVGDIAHYPNKLKLILTGFAEVATAVHQIFNLVHVNEELHWEYSTSRGVPGE
jgi:thioredoxin reductase (NADPH)|tara:strand:+ start:4398 stop:5414 length:1017 start_codon:yes stop_codon:yes gene_type:complete